MHLMTRAYLDYWDGHTRITSRRKGTIPPTDPDYPFNPYGRYGRLEIKTGKAGAELRATSHHFRNHDITFGILWEYQAQDDLRAFGSGIENGLPVYPLEDQSAFNNFGQDAERTLLAPYVEDIWQIGEDLTLNAGLRLDQYSDFGSSVNPRLGLTWQPHPRYSLRALYGTAFRAPEFRFLFLESPFIDGNADLKDEQVRTFEVGLNANPIDHLTTRLTLYHNKLKGLIIRPDGQTQFKNAGAMTSQGLELTAAYRWTNGNSLSANYSYVDATMENGERAADEPRNTASLTTWTPLSARLGAGLSLYWQDASARATGDPRSDLPGYTLLDLNLIYRLAKDVELGLAAYNLLDRDYAMPAPIAGSFVEDYRGAGRSLRAELRIAFR